MMACNDAANTLQSESDELTVCINNYVDSAAEESMRQYYTIIDNKLREKEIEKAEKYKCELHSAARGTETVRRAGRAGNARL